MQARAYRACETCRRSRRRCTGGPPCEACLERGKQTCKFIATAPRSKSFGQHARLDTDACLLCRSKNALCTGGPPCEECVEGSDMCSFDTEPHIEDHLGKGRRSACLPCRIRKVRCTGRVPPCEACTTRGSESTCEFVKTTKGDLETKTMHIQHQSDGAAEPYWNAVTETEPIQQHESTLSVGTDNARSPYTLTAHDTRRVRRSESLDCTEQLSTTRSVTSLSDLSRTPSLDASDSDGGAHASSLVSCSSYDEILHVLPSRQMIDSLIGRYFSSISMLFCVVNAAKFETQYEAFCRNTQGVTPSWLSLLFAILALGCRAEEDSKRLYLSDDLSIFYEKAAWHSLLASDSPSEPSLSALKAIVLIIYGRAHRGQDVFSDLQLAYRMAASIKGHSAGQNVVEPTVCEEYQCLLTDMKTLSLLNAQVHDYYHNQDLIQDLLPPADIYESTGRANLSLGVEESPPQMTFTILNLQLLEISHTIFMSAEIGFKSEWSLDGLQTELFRMEKHCSEVYANLGHSDSQLGSHQGSHGILHCYINYLVHLLFLPDLDRYLDGDITPETRTSQQKCTIFAKASLRNFNLLAENMQCKSYAWYIRGVGSYYAERSALTLTRCLAGFEEEDQDEEARRILNHTNPDGHSWQGVMVPELAEILDGEARSPHRPTWNIRYLSVLDNMWYRQNPSLPLQRQQDRTSQIGARLHLVSPYLSADMRSTQGTSYNDNFQYSAMEVMGYTKVQASAPPQELVTEVEKSLRSRPNVVSGSVTYGRGDHDACESYLKFGIQDGDFTRKIEEVIGRPAFLLHQGPVVVHSSNLPTNWGINAAHPVRNGVSVFRTLSGDLEDRVTTLKLYPISHHLSSAEFAQERGTPRTFHLRSNEVLFVRGALKMEISLPAGGFLAWQGFSEDPWGMDTSAPEAFAFMKI
ncbi:unnamed protein product [Penicillium salamii]|nr:unnamed protein product [Penicillium salamii]